MTEDSLPPVTGRGKLLLYKSTFLTDSGVKMERIPSVYGPHYIEHRLADKDSSGPSTYIPVLVPVIPPVYRAEAGLILIHLPHSVKAGVFLICVKGILWSHTATESLFPFYPERTTISSNVLSFLSWTVSSVSLHKYNAICLNRNLYRKKFPSVSSGSVILEEQIWILWFVPLFILLVIDIGFFYQCFFRYFVQYITV